MLPTNLDDIFLLESLAQMQNQFNTPMAKEGAGVGAIGVRGCERPCKQRKITDLSPIVVDLSQAFEIEAVSKGCNSPEAL